ncbi:MAG: aminopeptidase P N-terminal domain-containing protein [Bdellovibrionales bacterium]
MRKPTENVEIFKRRRDKVLAKLGSKALLVMAHPEYIRNDDVHYPYRQDSNLYYLTGFEEPESALLLLPGKNPQEVLFVRRKNPERETWDGFRYGPQEAQTQFQIQQVYPIDEFEERTAELLKGYDGLYHHHRKDSALDAKVMDVLEKLRRGYGRSGYGLISLHDVTEFMGEFRVIKEEVELENLRKACEITAQGHLAAIRQTKPGMTERQVQALLSYEFMNRGAAREGYNYIVASGASATTLHYNFNDQVCKDGDLLLIDAGAEYNYYTGDITRTFPVSKRFSKAQLEVYTRVLEVQKTLIGMVKPGVPFKKLHDTASELLTEAMIDLKLLSGRRDELIAANQHRKYYPHGVGHYLGLDVHDSGLYMTKAGEARPIEAGMCFTIEPGLYIPAGDMSAPAELRGIGVRIEDNVVVTSSGCEVMTKSAPKEVKDLEI